MGRPELEPWTDEAYRYPPWVTEEVDNYYERIAEGLENKPRLGLCEMIYAAYRLGIEIGEQRAEDFVGEVEDALREFKRTC